MSERIAVYCGTRNLYHDMTVAAKSMLYHRGADRIVFMIEDDTFPERLPPCIITMNVSGQPYFRHDGPNYNSDWTYMVLMRVALSKYFPQTDRILSMDVDTIVCDDISGLWNTDISRAYLAAVPENERSTGSITSPYYNFGVALLNLHNLRDGMDDIIIRSLNTEYYRYNEQDAVNRFCYGKIVPLQAMYNMSMFTCKGTVTKIKHFAFDRTRRSHDLYRKYDQMKLW